MKQIQVVCIALIAVGLLAAGTAAAADIVHDAEYYILEAQNGKRWAVEDGELATSPACTANQPALPPGRPS
jgi:arylsulfatase